MAKNKFGRKKIDGWLDEKLVVVIVQWKFYSPQKFQVCPFYRFIHHYFHR